MKNENWCQKNWRWQTFPCCGALHEPGCSELGSSKGNSNSDRQPWTTRRTHTSLWQGLLLFYSLNFMNNCVNQIWVMIIFSTMNHTVIRMAHTMWKQHARNVTYIYSSQYPWSEVLVSQSFWLFVTPWTVWPCSSVRAILQARMLEFSFILPIVSRLLQLCSTDNKTSRLMVKRFSTDKKINK